MFVDIFKRKKYIEVNYYNLMAITNFKMVGSFFCSRFSLSNCLYPVAFEVSYWTQNWSNKEFSIYSEVPLTSIFEWVFKILEVLVFEIFEVLTCFRRYFEVFQLVFEVFGHVYKVFEDVFEVFQHVILFVKVFSQFSSNQQISSSRLSSCQNLFYDFMIESWECIFKK